MADCNVSIDQENLPGVKEVCRDFAVLEDHCLAYNLQEQEIESHLASNVHKSRLVQQDLQVAKKLQEEEDLRAKAQKKRHQSTIERQDGEIAHEIQEELVRQEERQREQEEKDAAIARKLHEKEIKEERKRQKHVEPSEDNEYVEDQGASLSAAREPLDLDRPKYRSLSPSRQDAHLNSYNSPEYSSTEPKRSRYPKGDPVSPHSRSRYPEHFLETEGSRGRHADPYPDPLLPSRGKQRYPDSVPSETGWSHTADSERMVRKKERPARPFPTYRERDTGWEWDRETDRDRQYNRHERRGRQEERRHRDEEWPRDRGLSADRLRDQEHRRLKDPDRTRARSRDRVLDEDYYDNRHRRDRPSWEDEEVGRERRARDRRRMESDPDDVFEEHSARNRKESSELWEPHKREGPARERGSSHPSTETGQNLHKRNGAVEAESDYRLTEATKGMTKLDIHEQELKDREVARKLQEEELRKNSTVSRAAQVAQDEEVARLMEEEEKKEYKKQREREKERQREKEREKERERHAMDRMAADRKRQEAEYRPYAEDVVRPRTRDEYEYQRQKNHHKPTRPPQPRPQEYANMNPAYGYPDRAGPPRAPSRPEPTSRGAYYKR